MAKGRNGKILLNSIVLHKFSAGKYIWTEQINKLTSLTLRDDLGLSAKILGLS